MNIKTFLRIFFVLSLSLIFISCTKTYYNANIDSGKFDVYTPSPFYGAGTYILPNTHYFRGSLSVFPKKQEHLVSFGETENSQVMAVGGMHASDVEVVPQSEADLYYKLTNYYITGHIDFFQTINALEFGGRLGLNPSPYGLVTIGVNNIAVEAGMIYVGIAAFSFIATLIMMIIFMIHSQSINRIINFLGNCLEDCSRDGLT